MVTAETTPLHNSGGTVAYIHGDRMCAISFFDDRASATGTQLLQRALFWSRQGPTHLVHQFLGRLYVLNEGKNTLRARSCVCGVSPNDTAERRDDISARTTNMTAWRMPWKRQLFQLAVLPVPKSIFHVRCTPIGFNMRHRNSDSRFLKDLYNEAPEFGKYGLDEHDGVSAEH